MIRGRKPVYLLAGGRGSNDMAPVLDQIFDDIGKQSPAIAYVGAANGDSPDFFERMAGMLRSGRRCSIAHADLASEGADVRRATDIIESADAIFMSGGDVEAGMEVLEARVASSLFARLQEQGSLFFGISAGSIMLARQWVRWRDPDDDATAELFPCLGLAPVICDTHGEGDRWQELKSAVELTPEGTIGYGITSGACLKVHPDGRLQAASGIIATYVRRNNTVKSGGHVGS